MVKTDGIVGAHDWVLVTGASGFIGSRVLVSLLEHGFRRVRCLVRPSSDIPALKELRGKFSDAVIDICRGNLTSRGDCMKAVQGAKVIFHLAVGAGGKSFPDSFMGAVVTTRNLVEAALEEKAIRRFVNISSLAVYTNRNRRFGTPLDESAEIEPTPEKCGEAYCYAKVKQDLLVARYAKSHGLPSVTVRPGVVYGPGKQEISGRVGLGTFGIFLHLGGRNRIPFTYVDNCADAIVLAGITPGIEGEVFNVVDDDLPSSRRFLSEYKRHVSRFVSIPVPRPLSYLLCSLWDQASKRSRGQVPAFVNARAWHAYWKGGLYSNAKAKRRLSWTPRVTTREGMSRLFESTRHRTHA